MLLFQALPEQNLFCVLILTSEGIKMHHKLFRKVHTLAHAIGVKFVAFIVD